MTRYTKSKITDGNVQDIVDTAAYGGITYWAVEPTQANFDAAPEGAFTFRDGDEEDGGVHYVIKDQIRRAIVEVAEGQHTNDRIRDYVRSAFDNWTEEDGIDCGDIDADAADCIVQVACFGEVVYG